MCILKPHNPQKYKIDGCFLDPEKRFAFIHIYKNASISLRNALAMRKRYFKYNDIKNKNLKTITIIRNPIARIISMYLYLLRLEDNGRPDQHPTHITKQTCFYKNKDNTIKSFKYFIDAIEPDNFYDAVTYPQIRFLADRNLKISDIDEIFIQENLDNCYQTFKYKYGINNKINFPKDNRSNSNKKKLIYSYINTHPEIKSKISKIYSSDIKMYNSIINNAKF